MFLYNFRDVDFTEYCKRVVETSKYLYDLVKTSGMGEWYRVI